MYWMWTGPSPGAGEKVRGPWPKAEVIILLNTILVRMEYFNLIWKIFHSKNIARKIIRDYNQYHKVPLKCGSRRQKLSSESKRF